jgi:isoleucyl-tRNA synthetase
MQFKKVDATVTFPQIEKRILEFWEKEKIFEQVELLGKKRKQFTFYDGPPFATGLPHYGHIQASTHKDAVGRYWTMKGYYVPRKFGWDTHGLPVEYEIEKELNISGKQEIETMGVEAFNNACKGIVFRYTSEWEKTLKRVGRWGDYQHAYATMQRPYMESIWWVVKQIWDKGLVYQDYRSTWYCPRCGTPLSNFEVNLGYKDNVEDPSIYVKLQLEDDPNAYLLVWTTTPWTLPGNAAVAIHPELKYVRIKLGAAAEGQLSGKNPEAIERLKVSIGQELILAKDRLSVIDEPYEIVKEYKAKQLIGKKYKPLFSCIPTDKKAYYVLSADFVSSEEGTGIVHIAPAFGEDDFTMGKEHDLPVFRTVAEDGGMSKEVTQWAGVFVKEADHAIIDELTKRELMYKAEKCHHTYPFCWRCDSPLLNYSMKTWYIKVSSLRDRLVSLNQQIRWVPEHIKDGRFGKWLEGARDWNISRNRYWGNPLPIWQCTCGHQECIGSLAELKEKATYDFVDKIDELDLHRPYIDDVKLVCAKCGGEMKRVEEVLDCWFESGAMPYAQNHYPFEHIHEFEKSFPADFITEAIDQTRGWFYTLHVLAAILFDKPAFKNVIVSGIGLDEKGVKLSKRLRNYVEPEILMEEVGADAMRYYFYSSTPLGESWRFSDNLVKEKMRKVNILLYQSYSFFMTYASIDGWIPKTRNSKLETRNLLDRWILSKLQTLVKTVDEQMQEFELAKAARPIEDFIGDLSTWYIRRSRRRFWKSESDADKEAAYDTLYTVLVTMSKVIAPFMPFLAEELYQNLVRTQNPGHRTKKSETGTQQPVSVHMCSFPAVAEDLIDIQLEEQMAAIQQIVETARAIRSVERLKNRQPLQTLVFASKDGKDLALENELLGIVAEEINVKEVKQVKDIPEGFARNDATSIVVALDLTVTDTLKQEGLIRELVRQIQSSRKEAKFAIEDRIETYLEFENELLSKALKGWEEYVKKETLSEQLTIGKLNVAKTKILQFQGEVKVDKVLIKLGLKKL